MARDPIPTWYFALVVVRRDDRFLLASPNAYNSLGVGTTQLYDKTVVYNHKRHGKFSLGGRTFDFRVKPSFPKRLSEEFLLVDLVNNLDQLAESKQEVLARVKERAASYETPRLQRARQSWRSTSCDLHLRKLWI